MNRQAIYQFFKATTTRLALSYLAIIMLMSIGFSVVSYHTSSHELGRQLPSPEFYHSQRMEDVDSFTRPVNDFLRNRIDEGRQALLQRLIVLNLLALALGSVLSYLLAERTLRPIKKNMEAQEQFVSDASHELRTPLTALLTTNEVALRRKKISDPEAREILHENIDEIIKLQTLTSSLLRLARQENETVELQPESLQEVVSVAVNHMIKQIQAKDITLHESVPNLTVNAESDSLAQAVTIILDNAIKYSPTGGVIKIIGSIQGKFAVIEISDDGPGIATVDLPFIFDRFYRADQARGKHQADGYGIGLALAKKIVNQHGGEIDAVSEEGKGAAFIVKIPLARNI